MVGHSNDEPGIIAPNIYQFTVKDANGLPVQMRQYRGHVLLVVNVASLSGFAELNFKQLQQLQKWYRDYKFRVLAFPSDQLGNLEPGSIESIVAWANEKEYDLDFFDKIDVNGPYTPLMWRYLKTCLRGTMGDIIKWNFTKFLVNRKGIPVERHGPAVPPFALIKSIETLLDIPPINKPAE